jgi:hypothetical protein
MISLLLIRGGLVGAAIAAVMGISSANAKEPGPTAAPIVDVPPAPTPVPTPTPEVSAVVGMVPYGAGTAPDFTPTVYTLRKSNATNVYLARIRKESNVASRFRLFTTQTTPVR